MSPVRRRVLESNAAICSYPVTAIRGAIDRVAAVPDLVRWGPR